MLEWRKLAISKEGAIARLWCYRDLGMNNPKEIGAETEEEIPKLAAEDAENDHGIAAQTFLSQFRSW